MCTIGTTREEREEMRRESPCDTCGRPSYWAIARLEGDDMTPIFRAFACGRHMHRVLVELDWQLDAVQVYDMAIDRT